MSIPVFIVDQNTSFIFGTYNSTTTKMYEFNLTSDQTNLIKRSLKHSIKYGQHSFSMDDTESLIDLLDRIKEIVKLQDNYKGQKSV